MPLDPATLCARTATGDAELAAPRHGLAIAQRRLLSFLDQPLGIDELVRRPGVIPERLERDLSRLVENGLVEIHRPAATTAPGGRTSAARAAPDARASPVEPARRRGVPSATGNSTSASSGAAVPGAPVVIGRKVRRGRALAVGFLALTAALAAIWLFAAPETPGTASAPAGPASPTPRAAPGTSVATAPPVTSTALPAEPMTALRAAEPSPPRPSDSPAQGLLPSPIPPLRPVAAVPQELRRSGPPASGGAVEPAPAPDTALVPPGSPAPTAIAPPVASASPAPAAETGAAHPVPARTPAPAPAAAPSPATPATSAPAPLHLAAASPSALPSLAQPRALVPVSRESPTFPREALAAGVDRGLVRARLSIDASGRVTGVEIVDSQPRRVFDRAVSRTLSRWTYEPGVPGRTTDVEIAFDRE
jgi:protein TonB